ncbi:MAG: hypothetical protein KGK30_08330, partial [Elusimicrobia bacterium]|nr:hypothetical protein [Elusimicrobiota bacterium]
LLENRRRRLAEQWGVDYEQFSQPHHLMVAHAAGLYYKLLGDYTLLNPRDPSSETLSLFDIIERPVFNFISPTGKPAPVEPWQPPPLVYEKTESNSVVGNQDVFLTPDMEQGDRLRMRVLLDLEEAWPCVVFEFLNKETMWAKITVEDACDYWNKQRKFEVMGGQGLPASNLGAELRNAEGRFSLSDFFTRQDLYLWPNTIGAPFPLWPDFKDFALHLVTQYDPSGLKVFETFTSGLGIAFELLITKNRDDGLLEIQFVRQEDNGRLTRRIYLKEKQ